MDAAKESIGFVARWGLLAVATGLVLLTTVLAMSAGIDAVEADAPRQGTFSDVVWLHDLPVYVESRGCVTPPIGFEKEDRILSFVPGREPWLSRRSDRGLLVQVGNVPAGRHVVSVTGLPHSRNTFTVSTLILSVPRRRSVFLIGTENILRFGKSSSRNSAFHMLESFHRTAEPVWIHGGDADTFLRMRHRMGVLHVLSVLTYVDTQFPMREAVFRRFLRRSGLREEGVSVSLMTWDPSLAEMGVRLGLESHLILSEPAPNPAPAGVHVYPSLRKFKEYLDERPISD